MMSKILDQPLGLRLSLEGLAVGLAFNLYSSRSTGLGLIELLDMQPPLGRTVAVALAAVIVAVWLLPWLGAIPAWMLHEVGALWGRRASSVEPSGWVSLRLARRVALHERDPGLVRSVDSESTAQRRAQRIKGALERQTFAALVLLAADALCPQSLVMSVLEVMGLAPLRAVCGAAYGLAALTWCVLVATPASARLGMLYHPELARRLCSARFRSAAAAIDPLRRTERL